MFCKSIELPLLCITHSQTFHGLRWIYNSLGPNGLHFTHQICIKSAEKCRVCKRISSSVFAHHGCCLYFCKSLQPPACLSTSPYVENAVMTSQIVSLCPRGMSHLLHPLPLALTAAAQQRETRPREAATSPALPREWMQCSIPSANRYC